MPRDGDLYALDAVARLRTLAPRITNGTATPEELEEAERLLWMFTAAFLVAGQPNDTALAACLGIIVSAIRMGKLAVAPHA